MTTTISCGNCKGSHTSVAAVKDCYAGHYQSVDEIHRAEYNPDAPTEKQLAFMRRLLTEKDYGIEEHEVQRTIELGRRAVSTLIDALVIAPKKEKAAVVELADGIYKVGETVYKVYHTVHGANQQVAKELIQASGSWSFEYRGKHPLHVITAAHHLTAEEAKSFGLVYGVCINCCATLTREQSIHVGYGPTCAQNNGWWYPSKRDLRALANGEAIDIVGGAS